MTPPITEGQNMSIFSNIEKRDADTSALIPIERYRDDLNVFVMRAGNKYMDMVQVISTDLMSKSDVEVDYLNMRWAKFYKTCAADLKLISLNFPTNTAEQQRYFKYKIDQTKNPVFKRFLENNLSELIFIEKNRSDREYYLMYFADSEEQLKDTRNIISSSLVTYGLAAQMPKDKKIQILYRFNNPNATLFGREREE